MHTGGPSRVTEKVLDGTRRSGNERREAVHVSYSNHHTFCPEFLWYHLLLKNLTSLLQINTLPIKSGLNSQSITRRDRNHLAR